MTKATRRPSHRRWYPRPVTGARSAGRGHAAPARGIRRADLDGDGGLDLAVSNHLTDDVWILLGDGAGGLGAPHPLFVPDEPKAVAVSRWATSTPTRPTSRWPTGGAAGSRST